MGEALRENQTYNQQQTNTQQTVYTDSIASRKDQSVNTHSESSQQIVIWPHERHHKRTNQSASSQQADESSQQVAAKMGAGMSNDYRRR